MPTNPTPSNRLTIPGGKWLRKDAGNSYLRAIKRGMPLGGIASAGRTRDEQARLYQLWLSGKGNLAAPPGKSKHEDGLCLDITRGTKAHLWATAGGSPYTVRPGEKLRIHAYGWFRTVPSEAWHFQYFPAKDRMNRPTIRKFRFGQANMRGFRFGGIPSNLPVRGERLEERVNASIYALSEADEDTRDAIRKITGQKVWPFNYVSVMFGASWESLSRETMSFGTDIHGAVCAHMTDVASGLKLDVISIHVRPADSYPGKSDSYILGAKLDSLRRVMREMYRPKVSTVIAGDLNTTHAWDVMAPHGVVPVATNKPGQIDYTYVTEDIAVRSTTEINAGTTVVNRKTVPVSDHPWQLSQLTLGADTT